MWEKFKNEFIQGRTFLQFGFLRTFGYATTMLVSLVVARFISRSLWGKYSVSEMVIFFFMALFVTLPRMPFIIYANQERAKTGRISRSLSIQLIFVGTGFVIFSIIFLLFHRFLMNFTGLNRLELLCVALGFFGLSLKYLFNNLFLALNERIKSASIEPCSGVLALIIIFGLNSVGMLSLKTIFLTYFISSVIVCVIFLWFLNFNNVAPLLFDKEYFYKMLKFSSWMVFGIMSGYLIDWNGIAILKEHVSLDELGVFNLANKFFKGFLMLVYVISNYFLPHISENINNPEKIRYYLYHKRPVIFVFGLFCLLAAFLIIPYFLNLIYKDKFEDAVPIVRILLFGVVAFLYAIFYAPLIGAKERYKFAQIAGITQVLLNIALNLLLIPRIGIYGAAVSSVIAYIYLLVVYEAYFRLRLSKIVIPKQS